MHAEMDPHNGWLRIKTYRNQCSERWGVVGHHALHTILEWSTSQENAFRWSKIGCKAIWEPKFQQRRLLMVAWWGTCRIVAWNKDNQTSQTAYNSHAHSLLLLTVEMNNPCLYLTLTSVSRKTIVSDFPFKRGTSFSWGENASGI